MTARRPLVLDDNGTETELAAGDTIVGAAAGVPLVVAAGDTFVVPENVQMVYVIPIEVDGTLTIDGLLAQVS